MQRDALAGRGHDLEAFERRAGVGDGMLPKVLPM